MIRLPSTSNAPSLSAGAIPPQTRQLLCADEQAIRSLQFVPSAFALFPSTSAARSQLLSSYAAIALHFCHGR